MPKVIKIAILRVLRRIIRDRNGILIVFFFFILSNPSIGTLEKTVVRGFYNRRYSFRPAVITIRYSGQYWTVHIACSRQMISATLASVPGFGLVSSDPRDGRRRAVKKNLRRKKCMVLVLVLLVPTVNINVY